MTELDPISVTINFRTEEEIEALLLDILKDKSPLELMLLFYQSAPDRVELPTKDE